MLNNNNNPLSEESMKKFLENIISNRMYEIYSAAAAEDQTMQKTITAIKVIADKHNMTFAEMFEIMTELSMLTTYEE